MQLSVWIVARFSYGKKGAGMEIKDLVGAVVAHKIFGQGIVEDAHDNYLEDLLVRSNAIDIIVIDSVDALVLKAEIDGDMGDVHMGLQARLMSQAMRKLTPVVSRSKCIVIFINQLREKNASEGYIREISSQADLEELIERMPYIRTIQAAIPGTQGKLFLGILLP